MIRPLALDTLTPLAPIIGLENGMKNSTSAIPDVVYPISHTLNDEGGESYTFEDAPKQIYDTLNRYRLARVGGKIYEAEKKQT